MKKMNFALILSSVLCLVPIIISLIFYNQLPDKVATHWDANGVANGFSSKQFASFGMPLIFLVLNVIVNLVIESDPKKQNAPAALKNVGKFAIPVLAILCQAATIINAIWGNVNFYVFISAGIGLLFTLIGFYLPKCKQNYTVGIRLPWTLNSEINWDKTHNLSGKVWVVGGLIMIINPFLKLSWLSYSIIGLLIFVPFIYSFFLYKKGY